MPFMWFTREPSKPASIVGYTRMHAAFVVMSDRMRIVFTLVTKHLTYMRFLP